MSDAPKDDGCIGFTERKIGSRGLREGDLLSPLLFILVNGYGRVESDVEKN